MPRSRVPDDIDEWTPPWEDGKLDEEKAKRLLHNALLGEQKAKATERSLREELATKGDELDEALQKVAAKPVEDTGKDATINELQTRIKKLEKDGRPEDQTYVRKLEVALDHGLTKSDAKRLVGDTLDELEADATELAERFGISKDDGGDGGKGAQGDQGHSAPPSIRPAPKALNNGTRGEGESPDVVSAADLVAAHAKAVSAAPIPYLTR